MNIKGNTMIVSFVFEVTLKTLGKAQQHKGSQPSSLYWSILSLSFQNAAKDWIFIGHHGRLFEAL
jgi:hypothetical protein